MYDKIELLFEGAFRRVCGTFVDSAIVYSHVRESQNISVLFRVRWQIRMVRPGPVVTRTVSASTSTAYVDGIADVDRVLRDFDADSGYDGS